MTDRMDVKEVCDLLPPKGRESFAETPLTPDGYLAVEARVARTGVQDYDAREFGLEGEFGTRPFRIMRPENAVFDAEAVRSYAHRPVTLGHPPEFVNAKNWRQYAVGMTGDTVLRDGGFVRVPMVIMDAAAIDSIRAGNTKQLSLGYTFRLDRQSTEAYDAIARDIRTNHVSLVPLARGGKELRIDGADPLERIPEMPEHPIAPAPVPQLTTVAVDGLSVKTDDAGAQVLNKHLEEARSALDAERAERVKAEDAVKAAEAKIVVLEKAVEDAKLSPADLDSLVAEATAAKTVASHVLGKDAAGTPAELRRAVVDRQLGETAKGWDDSQVTAAFGAIASTLDTGKAVDGASAPGASLATALTGAPAKALDAVQKSRQDYDTYLTESWKNGGVNGAAGGGS